MLSGSGAPNSAKKSVSTAESIANTFEWLITAFILAFVFRAFVMEAFRIPTGSMAETLRGAHWQLRCPQCCYKYDYNYGTEMGPIIKGVASLPEPARCPSCGYFNIENRYVPISNGDRILVLKCIYQFFEPNRWDVVVFKNPQNPRENYIKRLIAKPGETIEIIDGDIYINNQIQRKPEKVQNELWMPVYDNDYLPVNPENGHFNNHQWSMPFKNDENSKWQLGTPEKPTVFTLDNADSAINALYYDSSENSSANDFRASYAYNRPSMYMTMPYCSDMMVKFFIESQSKDSAVGISLRKYDTVYTATADLAKQKLTITATLDGKESRILAEQQIKVDNNAAFSFANVDHFLAADYAGQKLTFDLGTSPDALGKREYYEKNNVAIIGSGKLKINHVKIFRDTHYTDHGSYILRAGEGNPLTLDKDEFFALGDNSPASSDGRMWSIDGYGNGGHRYPAGIVPRDYLVGKAFFVYWPGGFRLSTTSKFPWARAPLIPNIGQMKLIYGGK